MTMLRTLATALLASLALVACGSDDDSSGDGALTPVAARQHTLKPAEYKAMRDWIASSKQKAVQVRPVCETLRSGPGTPIVDASRRACGRLLALLVKRESEEASDLDFACQSGDRACTVQFLRENAGRHLDAAIDIVTDYHRDIRALMFGGGCRNVLSSRADVRQIRREKRRFEQAVHAFALGSNDALDTLENDEGDADEGGHDPKPCRPARGGQA